MSTNVRQHKNARVQYVCNHGAMVATEDFDPDGKVYALTRATVGPGRPVVATVDVHANISDSMVGQTPM